MEENEDMAPTWLSEVEPSAFIAGLDRLKRRIGGLAPSSAEPRRERGETKRSRPVAPPLQARIEETCRPMLSAGRSPDAAAQAAKALVYYVREKTGWHDLDDTALLRYAFRDADAGQSLRRLLEAAVLAGKDAEFSRLLREDAESAAEYVALTSLLARAVQRLPAQLR